MYNKNSEKLTDEQKKFITENYKTMNTSDMSRAINVRYDKVRAFCNANNIKPIIYFRPELMEVNERIKNDNLFDVGERENWLF